jgi:tetratricopeptide (TPR) repeat protein
MRCRALVAVAVLPALLVAAACSSSKPKPPAAAPDVNPNDPLAATMLMQQGQALQGEGRFDDAIAKYGAALALQPSNPVIHNLLGVAELQRGGPAKAIEHLNKALQLAPSYSDARNNRGAAYLQLGQLAQAESDFLAVLTDRTYANRTGVYFNLGALYVRRGDLAAAEENLRKAAVPSGPAEAFLVLAQVDERLGKIDSAEVVLRAAQTRDPDQPRVLLALAQFLDRQRGGRGAEELYVRIVSIAPDTPEAAAARERLRR